MVGRMVDFGADTVCRPPRDDERSVMKAFAAHASHCPRCTDDPYRVYLRGGTLCDRGHAYARDVAQYVYSKAGKAYSVVDRSADRDGPRVMIEIPPRCDAVRGLLKAVDQGLKVRSHQASRPVIVSYDPTYPVPERRLLPADRIRDGGYDVLEVAPRRHREERRREPASYVQTRGSLYEKDVEERRRRRKELGEPVIVYAEPRRRKEYYR